MRILLDTHSFLWFIAGDARISTTARALVADGDNEALLSIASLWEIAIKLILSDRLQRVVLASREDARTMPQQGHRRFLFAVFAAPRELCQLLLRNCGYAEVDDTTARQYSTHRHPPDDVSLPGAIPPAAAPRSSPPRATSRN